MIKEIAEAIKTFTPQQWGVVATIIAGCIGSWAYINNKFADRETSDKILDNVIAIDSKLTAIINTQYTPDQASVIRQSAAEVEEQMRKYRNSKVLKN